ncbi:MAG: hypothetical protein EP317_02985 [Bacillota bacterium]|nr:MAG: hypothetical protein EP317_02985 [Bacillota bacterium]
MKQRKLVIGLLVMLAVLASGFTYAFWAGTIGEPVQGTDSVTVAIGEGNSVTTQFDLSAATVSAGTTLVPSGMANDAGEVTSFTISFDVIWENAALSGSSLTGSTTTGDLDFDFTVEVLDSLGNPVTVSGAAALVVVTPDGGNATSITLNASAITLTVTVTLTEPINVAQYNDIKNGDIVIDFTFDVTNIVTN